MADESFSIGFLNTFVSFERKSGWRMVRKLSVDDFHALLGEGVVMWSSYAEAFTGGNCLNIYSITKQQLRWLDLS